MTETERKEKSGRIVKQIREAAVYAGADCMLCYVSLPEEVRTEELIRQALSDGKRVAVPRVLGSEMEFYYIEGREDLRPGCMGILEPASYCEPVRVRYGAAGSRPVPVIVPGLAFTRDGGRIGYGGGYYDRYFAAKEGFYMIGAAYDFQILDQMPTGGYDVRMDCVITEKGNTQKCAQVINLAVGDSKTEAH